MTTPRDPDGLIGAWLEEGPRDLPDTTRRAILTAVPTTARRRPAARWAWRIPMHVTRQITVAVVAIAGLGVAAFATRMDQGQIGMPVATTRSTTVASPSAVPTRAPTSTPASATPTGSIPLGLALVELDGTVRRELGLPRDAWMAALSRDGKNVVFITRSFEVGFCGACREIARPAIVGVGETGGAFVYPDLEGLGPEHVQQPVLSPDGTRLAFQGIGADGNRDIYVADLVRDGGPTITARAVRLTTDPATDAFPAWSPDGRTIVYESAGAELLDSSGFSDTQEIWSVPARGGVPTRLTENDVSDSQPDVSADGRIAFRHAADIWTMALDGSGRQRLDAVPAGLGFNPRWSPNGSKLALLRYDPSERAYLDSSLRLPFNLPLLSVVVVDLDSGAVTEVGARVVSDVNPVSWTPDGEALLINRFDTGG